MGSAFVLVRRLLKSSFVLSLLASILLTTAQPFSVAGEDGGPRIDSIRVGFGGRYKVGYWTPVWIKLAGGQRSLNAHVEVSTPDGDGVPTRFVQQDERPMALRADDTVTVQRYVKPGRARGGFAVQLRGEDRVLATRVFSAGTPLGADRELIVTYGPSIGVEEAFARRSADADVGPVFCRLDGAAELPDDWLGYEGVNVVVLTTSQWQRLRSLSDSQLAGMQQWVRMGGRLIFCVGVFSNGSVCSTIFAMRENEGRRSLICCFKSLSRPEILSRVLDSDD